MQQSIAVIGAGMAGMSCAHELAIAGAEVTVFDKGRSLGGRMATRRSGDWTFNHGVPSFHASEMHFRIWMQHLAEKGTARRDHWDCQLYSGNPHMNELLKPLAQKTGIQQAVEISRIECTNNGWRLSTKEGQAFETFDAVLVCIPAPQAQSLIASVKEDWASSIETVEYTSCLTMLLGTERFNPALSDRQFVGHHVLDMQVRQETGNPTGEAWVVYATPDWSSRNLNCEREEIALAMMQEFAEANNLPNVDPVFLRGHRWRYARVSHPLGQMCLWDHRIGLGLAGDWCLGDGVEYAFMSGTNLADHVLKAPH